MSEKYIVTWDMLQIHARKLASRLMPSEQWKGIIAVSRGGLVPGALLARELGIRHVDTVCISSYDHDNQRELKVLKRAEGDGEGSSLMTWWIPVVLRLRFVKCIQKRTLSPSSQNRPVARWLMIMLLISRKIPGSNNRGIWASYSSRQSPVANLFNAWHCRALFFLTSGRLQ